MTKKLITRYIMAALLLVVSQTAEGQKKHGLFHRIDSLLTVRYQRANIDTNYVTRPQTKWALTGRVNVSGLKLHGEGNEAEGIGGGNYKLYGRHFEWEMSAERKTTVSFGVSYMGVSLNLSLNPAKILGKYHDYELNFRSYGKRFGFDIAYQNARNLKGWYEDEGEERMTLPEDAIKLQTVNMNAYYVFNNRRFSYPAAFAHSYLQRRSAGSFMLAVSGNALYAETQNDNLDEHQQPIDFKIINLGIGGGYGYNFVPGKGWLLHISALPTMIVYSHASLKANDTRIPLHYRFPEFIITSRGSVVKQIGRNMFAGVQMVYHFTSMGHKESLDIYHEKWIARAYFGYRL